MSTKAKKIVFWIFVGLIVAGAALGLVYTFMPEDNVEPEAIEATIDSTAVDTTCTVVDTVVVAE